MPSADNAEAAQPVAGPPLACCAIIPAFDEATRVGRVVEVCVSSQLFQTVLVIDDGSQDDTAAAAKEAGAKAIRHETNRGKAEGMLTGLRNTSEPIVCFLDADLLAVTSDHLRHLVQPVCLGEHRAQLAVFSGGRMATTLAQKVAPMISGQRCLRRELLDGFEGWGSGFGIETAINAHLLKHGVHMQIVDWHGAAHVMKEEKRGLLRGLRARLGMYRDIAVTWLRTKRQ
jgi:glycosyltransferase involved in cell wall biosynthesis